MKKNGIINPMDRQAKRLEDSYKKYPVHIPEELFREGFELGKKLGLITDEQFEELFNNAMKLQLNQTVSLYFIEWTDQLNYYLKPYLLNKDYTIADFLSGERKILNMRNLVIGEKIANIARIKHQEQRVSFGPNLRYLIDACRELLPELNIEFIRYDSGINTYTGIGVFNINGNEVEMSVNTNTPQETLDKINEYLLEIKLSKRLVRSERIFSARALSYSIMLVNNDALKFEDNKFIPFYYKNNVWVIDKEEITSEQRNYVENIARLGLNINKLFEEMSKN